MIAPANRATNLAAPHAVAGRVLSVDHEASIATCVRKYQERKGIGCLTPKMLVERQEEINEEGIDPMIQDNSTSVLVGGRNWSQVGPGMQFFQGWHSKISQSHHQYGLETKEYGQVLYGRKERSIHS